MAIAVGGVMRWPEDLLLQIERAAVRGWPAFEQINVDGWTFRRSKGGSIRANSVAALDWRGSDAERSIAEVERLAADRGVPACFTVSDASTPDGLDQRLAMRGYLKGEPHVTMAKAVAGKPQPPPDMEIGDRPSADWMAVYLSGLAEDRRATAPLLIKGLPKTARFFSALDELRAISSGVSIVDGDLASVQCMATADGARRRRGAWRVLEAIETVAGVSGAKYLYLQTGAANTAARALYERFGFEVVGQYHTRTRSR